MSTPTPKVNDVIAEVLRSPHTQVGDVASRAEFIQLRAEWTAYVENDLRLALGQLQHEEPHLGLYAGMLRATEVQLLRNLDVVPSDFSSRLEVADDLPGPVKLTLLETQMSVLVGLGRFADARRVFRLIEALEGGELRHTPRALLGMTLFEEGHPEPALELLQRGFDEAHGYLDIDAVRAFGARAAMCHLAFGDYAAVDEFLEVIFSAGEPSPLPPGLQLSVLAIAAVVATRRGQITSGERLAAELSQLRSVDGPLPGQSSAWAKVQLLAFDGQTLEAADLLAESGQTLWERGARIASLWALLSAVELDPTAARLNVALEHLSQVPEARTLAAHAAFVTALVSRDANDMLATARPLSSVGLIGMALSACRLARAWFTEVSNGSGVREAEQREQKIRAAHPGRSFDLARFGAVAIMLTDREKEVGRLAADGLSNAEIATRLVLSVRTVESHMHRIMRKLDLSNRRSLRRHQEILK